MFFWFLTSFLSGIVCLYINVSEIKLYHSYLYSIIRYTLFITWRNNAALRKWIPGETFHACANWQMIQYVTLSVYSTRAWARVWAPLIDTCEMTLALGAQNAFWSTLWRYANVIRQARACRIAGYDLTQRVRTARRRGARWGPFSYRNVFRNWKKW